MSASRPPASLPAPGYASGPRDTAEGPRSIETPVMSRAIDRWLLRRLQRSLGPVPVELLLWDGASAYAGGSVPVARVRIKDRQTLLGIAVDPSLQFGERYMNGRLEVQGELVACLEALYRAPRPRGPAGIIDRLRRLQRESNTLARARRNIHHHYDIGNDFYQCWLDRELVYTCAYFPLREMTLEEAQIAKMEYVCRKLRLQSGERVVEAGCGWGALALHMARHHGVSVRAFNTSHEQIHYACRRAAEEGLAGRVEFVEDDYRNITGRYDVFVSVGMLEHVGRRHYRALGDVIARSLDEKRGRGLLHFIGRNRPQPLNPWIRRRIFPGGYPPTLAEMTTTVLEPRELSVLDVENLRLHYAETLRHWLARFERAADQVRAWFDERFTRAWRLYLAGSQAAFTTGALQLFQVVFARAADNAIPWTRAGLYERDLLEPPGDPTPS